MIINAQKSRIMRVLLRSKCKGISNSINIPEIDSYCYLGVNITQSLRLDDHELKMRKIQQFLNRTIGMLKLSMLMTKSRLMLFKSILRAKVSYAWTIIWSHNRKYIEKWESMLYRLLKRKCWIKMNVIKQRLFKILGIKNNSEYIYKNRVLLKKIRKWLRVNWISINKVDQSQTKLFVTKETSKAEMKLRMNNWWKSCF